MKITTRLFIIILIIISGIFGYISVVTNSMVFASLSIIVCLYAIGYSICSGISDL